MSSVTALVLPTAALSSLLVRLRALGSYSVSDLGNSRLDCCRHLSTNVFEYRWHVLYQRFAAFMC